MGLVAAAGMFFWTAVVYRRKGLLFSPSFFLPTILFLSLVNYFLLANVEYFSIFKIIPDMVIEDDLRVYFFIMVFFLPVMAGASSTKRIERVPGVFPTVGKINFDLSSFLPLLYPVLILVYIFAIAHFVMLEKVFLWENQVYLMINEPDWMGVGFFPLDIFHKMSGFIGFLFAFGFFVCMSQRKYSLALLFAPLVVYVLVIRLGANSRWAPLILSTGLILWFSKNRVHKIGGFLCLLLVVWFFSSVLYGRLNPYQGISQISENMLSSSKYLGFLIQKIYFNVFSGGLNFYAALVKIGTKEYPLSYQALSFSFLPSLIDSFRELKSSFEIRVNYFVPFSFFAELYYFKLGFTVFFGFVLWFLSSNMNWVYARSPVLGYVCSLPAIYFFLRLQQYPIRNSFRFALMTILICSVVRFYFANVTKAQER